MKISIKLRKESRQDNISATSPDEYPCLSIFLPILENEYMEEKARTDRIDNKAIALLTIIIALITIYVPIIPFEKVAQVYSEASACCLFSCIFSLFLLLGIIAIVIAIYSAKKIIEAYKPTEFPAINVEHLNTNENLSCNPAYSFQLKLIQHFQSIILSTSETNTKKAVILVHQVKNVTIVFILLSVSAIGTLICSGI